MAMRWLMAGFAIFMGIISAEDVAAAGWATMPVTAVEQVDGGILMYTGTTNNPNNCDVTGKYFFPGTANLPKQEFLSMAMTAFATGSKIRIYSYQCVPVPHWSGSTTTYNRIDEHYLRLTN